MSENLNFVDFGRILKFKDDFFRIFVEAIFRSPTCEMYKRVIFYILSLD